ncbi:GGDEF domain-containing response regulator [Neobacillus sp. Marseille-QA0830]
MAISNPSALYQSYSRISVLYVEDEMFSREKILRVLGRRFSTIHAALDGREGIDFFQKYQPDLLIIDLNENQPYELDMIHTVRKLNGQIPIIITGPYDGQKFYQSLLDKQVVNHVIPKPIYLESFLYAIQQSVHQIETKREMETFKKQQMSTMDHLTNSFKRFKFNEILDDAISKMKINNRSFSLVVMDLDNLNRVNTRFGHEVGDHVLRIFSTIVQQRIEEKDIFARWGGDCFTLMLPETEIDDTRLLAESLRILIENFPFDHIGRMTCSMGIAAYSSGMSKRDLVFRAEQALYEAKQAGKNRVIVGSTE